MRSEQSQRFSESCGGTGAETNAPFDAGRHEGVGVAEGTQQRKPLGDFRQACKKRIHPAARLGWKDTILDVTDSLNQSPQLAEAEAAVLSRVRRPGKEPQRYVGTIVVDKVDGNDHGMECNLASNLLPTTLSGVPQRTEGPRARNWQRQKDRGWGRLAAPAQMQSTLEKGRENRLAGGAKEKAQRLKDRAAEEEKG